MHMSHVHAHVHVYVHVQHGYMCMLFGLLVDKPLLLRYYIGNLVVAALRRHEALGWLGLEVKRDSLRGNFVAASTRTRRARRWGWCQDG